MLDHKPLISRSPVLSKMTIKDNRTTKEQIGGSHYKNMVIQPIQYIQSNRIGYMEGNAIKYLSRWESKGGIEDLKKAHHYIDMLIEFKESKLS